MYGFGFTGLTELSREAKMLTVPAFESIRRPVPCMILACEPPPAMRNKKADDSATQVRARVRVCG